MVTAYVAAGFNKIHLDASMRCADDPTARTRGDPERGARYARLPRLQRAAPRHSPVYVIGTEVPTPGGAVEEMEIEVTSTEASSKRWTYISGHFRTKEFCLAWERIVGVVVQPGVEFGNENVEDDAAGKGLELQRIHSATEGIVFEAHSTDYQTAESLGNLSVATLAF